MKIEHLIVTPEIQRERRILTYAKIQFFCFGIAAAALAGAVDAWWKSYHVAGLFAFLGVLAGIAKVISSRPPRAHRRTHVVNPLPLPRKAS